MEWTTEPTFDRQHDPRMSESTGNTKVLNGAQASDRNAINQLFGLTYEELKRAARHRLSRQHAGETLNATALVHEAYLRLIGSAEIRWEDRGHFFALASRAMRFVLIDHARSRCAQKRGGPALELSLEDVEVPAGVVADLLDLNDALEQLARFSPRLAQLVEYRFFGGLTHEEIADITGVSVRTIKRDWTRARTWLFNAMRGDGRLREADRLES